MNISRIVSSLPRTVAYGERIRPTRDWFVLLSIASLLVVVSVVWNVFLLVRIERGEAIDGSTPTPTAFDNKPIEAVKQVFLERAEEERRFRQEYRFVDPSRSGS